MVVNGDVTRLRLRCGARAIRRRCRHDRSWRLGTALAARPDRAAAGRAGAGPRRRLLSPSSSPDVRALYDEVLPALWPAHRLAPCAQASFLGARCRSQLCAQGAGREAQSPGAKKSSPRRIPARVRAAASEAEACRRLCMECCRMTSAAEHRKTRAIGSRCHPQRAAQPGDPDRFPTARSSTPTTAAEAFFEISTPVPAAASAAERAGAVRGAPCWP